MNIIMSGCSGSFGKAVRERLQNKGHLVFGVGLGGPHYIVDFLSELAISEDVVTDIFDEAENFFDGNTTGLINNAGITRIDFTSQHSLKDFIDVMHVNLTIPWLLSREFVRRTERDASTFGAENLGLRRIINTSSMAATSVLRASPGYCASKAGLESITKVMAKELAGKLPILVAAIAPGGVDNTDMVQQAIHDLVRTRGMSLEEANKYNRQSPFGRNMTHEEVVDVFDFAINKMPIYMSGTILKCTGGMGI